MDMTARISVCAKRLSFNVRDSGLSFDVHISCCSIRVSTIL